MKRDLFKDGFAPEMFDLSWDDLNAENNYQQLYKTIAEQANAILRAALAEAQTVECGADTGTWHVTSAANETATHTAKIAAAKGIEK